MTSDGSPDASAGSLQALRRDNRARILRLLREHGTMHRAELARQTGLARSTVSTLIAELLADQLVVDNVDVDDQETQAGRPRSFLALAPHGRVAVGMDFDYLRVRVVVSDLAHEILAEEVAPLSLDRNWAQTLDLGVDLLDQALAKSGHTRRHVLGIGLGVPGPIDLTSGQTAAASHSPDWVGVRSADELRDRVNLPTTVDNTAHLASLAETVWGAGRGSDNLVYLKLSAGVGSGLVFDGRIFRGSIGAAGEIGHLCVDESGPACRCGSRGCLETYVGANAVLDALRPLLGDDVTVAEVLDAVADGNRACLRVLSDIGHTLGGVLADVCNLLNPQRVVIGGDLANAGQALFDPVREALSRRALAIIADNVEIGPAELGDQAGALGGIALVLREGQHGLRDHFQPNLSDTVRGQL